jgi:hypothetical protein
MVPVCTRSGLNISLEMTGLHSDIVRRLAFARYIFSLGKQQAKARSPLNVAAILTFHDAAELFLQIGSEYLDTGKNQPNFMDYFDLLSSKTSEPLSQKEGMRRLNKARVALKHHGTMSSTEDVGAFRETVSRFFEENTPRIFGVSFVELTLVEFVEPETARQRLRAATDAVARGTIDHDVLTDLAIAFDEIIKRREQEISPRSSFPVFPFGPEFPGPWGLRFHGRDVDPQIAKAVTSIAGVVGGLQRICKLLIMGVDFTGMLRFQAHTPTVAQMMAGNYQTTFRQPPDSMADLEDVDFCIQFVVETSLAFQQGVKPWTE